MTKSTLWWGGLSGLAFGVCSAILITDNRFSQTLIVISLFVVGCIAGSISGIALSVAGGVAASGVFVSGLDHLPGNLNIPMWEIRFMLEEHHNNYNHYWPHSSLQLLIPVEFATKWRTKNSVLAT